MSLSVTFWVVAWLITFILWWMEESRHSKTVEKQLDTERKLTQAILEMKAIRALYAKDAQELIQLRAFKKRFDAMLAARKKPDENV